MANVVLLFKMDSKDKQGNYSPVSLTSVVGTFLKGILQDRKYQHVDRLRLIPDSSVMGNHLSHI